MYRFFLVSIVLLSACAGEEDTKAIEDRNALFQRLPASVTGIHFQNDLTITEDLDVFRYRNFYNGGGVAIADINNDGLADIYLTSNMGDNKLYLNKGNWKFEDITERAGVKGRRAWATGVSIVDINSDGFLDIYVCNAGDVKGGNRENELFINNGDLTFRERAQEYGLADNGFSTHAAFFDYDKDGDLDCYVLNNSYRPVSSLGYRNLRNERDELGGHKLYRNDRGRYVDISEAAGIYGSVIGFGLGVTVGDVNQDNWQDIYVSNDFYERDYLYINNKDGTFSESLENYMEHISMFSMGADLADLDNDGYPEIFSTDMLPTDDYRLKTLSAFETYDVYQLRLKNDYYHQFMRNMLHRNNQDGTFSEIGELAGVSATDWSWGALLADFNNDRYKEIFVCNGIYKDVTNQDFVEFLGNSEQMKAAIEGKKIDFKDFVDRMPSVKLSNHMFTRTEPWKYQDITQSWGLDEPSFSNGAAYGDLDNDGDLDLVINNVNQEVFTYQNQSQQKDKNHFIAMTFKGTKDNRFGLGACVRIYMGDEVISQDNMPIRGFQSSMDYKMTIGLGAAPKIDSIVVMWPDMKIQIIDSVRLDEIIHVNYANAVEHPAMTKSTVQPLLKEINYGKISHDENFYNDFDRDRLQYHMLSTMGPALAKGDLNGDGLDDIYVGGSIDSPGKLYVQKANTFIPWPSSGLIADSLSDQVDATFFDADGDKDLDLYVVTGGSENTIQSAATGDKLYLNMGMKNGAPVFEKSNTLPAAYQSGSCVRPEDFDQDGDLDLFVGTRVLPSYYGMACDQLLLVNDGKGNFTEATIPEFKRLGMVTDAVWFDYDNNKFPDLLVIGDWMPITVFQNDGKQLKRITVNGLDKSNGWWNRLHKADLDNDGDEDFIVGNLGENSKFKPTLEKPVKLYLNDFDQNGSMDPVFTFVKDGKDVPFALRQDIIKQMSSLKKKFVFYKDYADKALSDIVDPKLITSATQLEFYQPGTSILINEGQRGFTLKALPLEAQSSPVFGINTIDVNNDNKLDIILGGNLFAVKPEVGRYDALHGAVLLGDGKGNFEALPSLKSGFMTKGEIRQIALLNSRSGKIIAVVRNNDDVKFYTLK